MLNTNIEKISIFFLIPLIEHLTERIKDIRPDTSFGLWVRRWTPFITIAIGILLTGVVVLLPSPYKEIIIWGIIASGGSNFYYEVTNGVFNKEKKHKSEPLRDTNVEL